MDIKQLFEKLNKSLTDTANTKIQPGDESIYRDTPRNRLTELINKNLGTNLPKQSLADEKQYIKDLPENMASGFMGSTRAVRELGRYAGKMANTNASLRENLSNADMLSHMRDIYSKLKNMIKLDPKKAEELGNSEKLQEISKAMDQFKTTGKIDQTSTNMDELWTDYYNQRLKGGNVSDIPDNFTKDYKKYTDSPKSPMPWDSPDKIERLVRSNANAKKFYNPADKVGEKLLENFKTKQYMDEVGTMREFEKLKKAIQSRGEPKLITDDELIKSYPKDPSVQAMEDAQKLVDEKLKKKIKGEFDPEGTNPL